MTYIYNFELRKSIRVEPKDVDEYLSKGWVKGRGTTLVYKDGVKKQVFVLDVPTYLSQGWTR